MKKTFVFFIFLLMFILQSCRDGNQMYFIYIKSTDSIENIQIHNAQTVETNKTKTVALPYSEDIVAQTGHPYKVKIDINRLNNQGEIRGLIWQEAWAYDTVVAFGDTISNPLQVFVQHKVTTADSLLDYYKSIGYSGYFEQSSSETSKSYTFTLR